MEKIKRTERLSVISHLLTQSPNHIFPLSRFCQMFQTAKSTVSEDIHLIRQSFEAHGLGQIETIAGAAGGVRYLPFPQSGAKEFLQNICRRLSDPMRVLPGGYLYTNDLLASPENAQILGRLMASQFYKLEPDFVLTVETRGIPFAMATAHALGTKMVVARRDQQRGIDWPYVSINYLSGSTGRLQTMSLSKRLVREGQRALIIDDFMKAGGTARGMMEMMREFSITVVGVGMMLLRETETKKRVEGVKTLMTIRDIDEEKGAVVLPAPWIE